MKKLLVIAGSVLLFFSCGTTQTGKGIIFDNSIPVEQTAEIANVVGIVTGYNGIEVKWKMGGVIQIPAGDTLLEFDVNYDTGDIVYKGKNMLFRYNFQPQKWYYLWFAGKYEDRRTIYGVNVYTYEIGEKVTQGGFKDHFTEFVPFLGEQDSKKTVLD